KKLKLNELNLSNAEVLTREQLKKVFGGMTSGSGPFTSCKTGSCTLSIQGSGGGWITRNGTCAYDVGKIGPFPDITCYCETGLGDVPITSNGGESRCTE